MKTFDENLNFGNDGENEIRQFLISKGCAVIPSYDYTSANRQAPRIYHQSGFHVLPDMDCALPTSRFWVECKRYTTSPWNKNLSTNTHGIKIRLYDEYMQVQKKTGSNVWLFILEESVTKKNGEVVPGRKILCAQIDTLPLFSCQCKYCRIGHPDCMAPVKKSIYFRRDDFSVVWQEQEQPDRRVLAQTSGQLFESREWRSA